MGINISRRALLSGAAALSLSGCVTLDPAILAAIGAKVEVGDVDFAELLVAAQRTSDAHKSEAEIRKIRPGTVRVAFVEAVKTSYFIEVDHQRKAQYLAIPGSANLTNWLTDFDAAADYVPASGLAVHRGFALAAVPTYEDLKPYLRKDYKVHLSGHSMGGALAVIIGALLKRDGYQVARIITFGQPKVTDAVGVALHDQLPLTRVVNGVDIVSMVPGFPFEHFGEEVILLEGEKYVYLSSKDANQVSIGEFLRTRNQLSASDHDLQLYIDHLALKLKRHTAMPYSRRLEPETKVAQGAQL